MTNFIAVCIALVGVAAVGAIAIVLGTLLNGWTLSILWGWFVVPYFGVEPLSVPLAIGLCVVVGFMTHQYVDVAKNPESKWWTPLLVLVSRPLLALVVGWCVKSFL